MNTNLAIDTLRAAALNADDGGLDAHVAALRALLGGEIEAIESELPRILDGSVAPLPDAGQHLLAAGGKRVRPMLTLLVARALGIDAAAARRLACAGELVHLATLLHDDVIDDADVRRGRSTPRRIWGNSASVLSGDYALTRALDLVADVDSPAPLREAIDTLRKLVEGEVLQLGLREGARTGREGYFAVIDRKTASLFAWCCRAPAHLAAGAPVDAYGDFGFALGRCFQIVDDVLDFDAGGGTGKGALADLREGKLTLPVLIALERDEALARGLRGDLAQQADAIEASVHRTHALQAAREVARREAAAAVAALQNTVPGPERDALAGIADALAARVR